MIKILLSADFESNFTRLHELEDKADICISCGDIFDYHKFPEPKFEFPLPFYSIKGNKELWGKEKLHRALESTYNFFWLNQHLDRLEEETGICFFGIDYFREPATIPDDVDVLVAHEPAFGLADECSDPFHTKMIPHCGSKAVRRLVDRYHPEILVAGHVHSFQKHRVENTLAITLPAALSDPIIMITGKENNKIVLSFG